jgi:hypothetical protein
MPRPDIAVLTRTRDDAGRLVRERAALALRQLDGEREAPGSRATVAQHANAGSTRGADAETSLRDRRA